MSILFLALLAKFSSNVFRLYHVYEIKTSGSAPKQTNKQTNKLLLLLKKQKNLEALTFRTCCGYRSAQSINSFHSLVVVAYMLRTCWGNNKAIIYQWSEIPQKFPRWLYIRILRISVYHPLDGFSNTEAAFETLKGMSFGSQKLCDLVYEIRSLPVVCMWHRFRV